MFSGCRGQGLQLGAPSPWKEQWDFTKKNIEFNYPSPQPPVPPLQYLQEALALRVLGLFSEGRHGCGKVAKPHLAFESPGSHPPPPL